MVPCWFRIPRVSKIMQIAAFLRWFRLGSCWFRGRRAGNIAFCPCCERLTCRECPVISSIPALVPNWFLLVPWPACWYSCIWPLLAAPGMLRTSCYQQYSCFGSAMVPVGSVAGVLVVLHLAPALSHLHAENVMQIAAFLPWFRIGSCWFRGRRAGNIAFCPCYEPSAC